MKPTPLTWTPDIAHKMESRVDPKPQYQRGSVWTRKQKQLLMDSILPDTPVCRSSWLSARIATTPLALAVLPEGGAGLPGALRDGDP